MKSSPNAATLDEIEKKWLYGPLDGDELKSRFPLWIAARRVGIWQDYSVYGHNEATDVSETVTLGSDVFAAMIRLLRCSFSAGLGVTLSDGTRLTAEVHDDWRTEGPRLVGRTLDVKTAYPPAGNPHCEHCFLKVHNRGLCRQNRVCQR